MVSSLSAPLSRQHWFQADGRVSDVILRSHRLCWHLLSTVMDEPPHFSAKFRFS